jgi:hypothetical protein
MLISQGSTQVSSSLGKVGEPDPTEDRWGLEAGAMLLNGLMRIFSSGNVPVEVHVDPSKIEEVRGMDLEAVVDLYARDEAGRENVLQIARWWNANKQGLTFTPREGFTLPVVISQSEQAEAEIFAAVFSNLQSRGLESALNQLGIDVQTLMKSPKLFQETVWFQFQFLLHERLRPPLITVPDIQIQ